jgi:hypothetical protein
MSANSETKKVFRLFWAWEDEKEEAWLSAMAREGWHLVNSQGVRFIFRRGEPADVVYRLDYRPERGLDIAEYYGLFRDAGWEPVTRYSGWHYFRTPVGGSPAPEIFSDTQSRIEKYRRLAWLVAPLL